MKRGLKVIQAKGTKREKRGEMYFARQRRGMRMRGGGERERERGMEMITSLFFTHPSVYSG